MPCNGYPSLDPTSRMNMLRKPIRFQGAVGMGNKLISGYPFISKAFDLTKIYKTDKKEAGSFLVSQPNF